MFYTSVTLVFEVCFAFAYSPMVTLFGLCLVYLLPDDTYLDFQGPFDFIYIQFIAFSHQCFLTDHKSTQKGYTKATTKKWLPFTLPLLTALPSPPSTLAMFLQSQNWSY